MTDIDRRTLQSMMNIIKNYRERKISLESLINSLYAAYTTCNFLNRRIDNNFLQKYVDIESVYSDQVNYGRHLLNLQEEGIINSALEVLDGTIEDSLRIYLNAPDTEVKESATIIDENWLMCAFCQAAWESSLKEAMVICPVCDKALHNPRYQQN